MPTYVWVCVWEAEKPLHISRGPAAIVRVPPRDPCIKGGLCLALAHLVL